MLEYNNKRHWFIKCNNAVSPKPESSSLKRVIPSPSTFYLPHDGASLKSSKESAEPPVFDCGDGGEEDDGLFNETQPAIRPIQVLTERLEAWYCLSRCIHAHFTAMAAAEHHVAKTYQKANAERIFGGGGGGDQDPLLQTHFAFTSGIRSICEAWQDYQDARARDHAALAEYLKTGVLPNLRVMKRELKRMIRSIQNDDRLKLSKLAKLRQEAKKGVDRLNDQLAYFEHHQPAIGGGALSNKKRHRDPWLVNAAVAQQMIKVYHQTNKMHETVFRLQQEVLVFEQQLIQELKKISHAICKLVLEEQQQQSSSSAAAAATMRLQDMIESVKPDGDWLDFVDRFKHHLIPEDAPFRHPDRLYYPNHDHPLLQPLFASRMERNSSVLHRWHEHMYVLTPAGFLHEYKSTKNYPHKPDLTLFVPHYNVSTLSTNLLHHNLVFQLEPHHHHCPSYSTTTTTTTTTTPSSSLSFFSSTSSSYSSEPRKGPRKTITFRAKSATDMQTWLEHLTELSNRYRPCVSYQAPLNLQPSNPKAVCHTEEPEQTEPIAEQPAEEEPPQQQEEKKEEEPVSLLGGCGVVFVQGQEEEAPKKEEERPILLTGVRWPPAVEEEEESIP